MATLEVTFHGVRGSLAAPGAHTRAVGGNTSCVEVTAAGTRIVLDAGTGLRQVGERVIGKPGAETAILLSHLHWDHIQGLPFFAPIYTPGQRVRILSGPNGVMPLADALRRQMSAPFFPVAFDALAGSVTAVDLKPADELDIGGVHVVSRRLNHPDPVYGYRLEHGGRAIVYATDTEHYRCVDPALVRLARGADLLIYDAQYTPEEYSGAGGHPPRVGWGHSTYEAAAELARAAGVGELVLFHHDPARTDDGVAAIQAQAQRLFARTTAAREGMVIAVGGRRRRRDAGPGRGAVAAP